MYVVICPSLACCGKESEQLDLVHSCEVRRYSADCSLVVALCQCSELVYTIEHNQNLKNSCRPLLFLLACGSGTTIVGAVCPSIFICAARRYSEVGKESYGNMERLHGNDFVSISEL